MKIDRRRFLTLAFAMGAAPGCVIREESVEYSSGAEVTAPPPQNGAPRATDPGCAETDPTGECVRWYDEPAPGEPGYATTDECIDWDPSNECIAWEPRNEYSHENMPPPANECVQYTPTGECTAWAPVVECIQWDPTGECIGWS